MRCAHESAGKKVGSGGKKIGNAHLRWAFGEAACLFLRGSERAKRWKERQAKRRGEGKALAILAARLGRGVWQCFRCGAGGNALDLWARATGQPLYAAVLELYRRLGRPVPWLRGTGKKDKTR